MQLKILRKRKNHRTIKDLNIVSCKLKEKNKVKIEDIHNIREKLKECAQKYKEEKQSTQEQVIFIKNILPYSKPQELFRIEIRDPQKLTELIIYILKQNSNIKSR